MPRPTHSTTKLPKVLRDELGLGDASGGKGRDRRFKSPAARKANRKRERENKKSGGVAVRGKAQNGRGKVSASNGWGRTVSAVEEDDELDEDDFEDFDDEEEVSAATTTKSKPKTKNIVAEQDEPKSILKKSKTKNTKEPDLEEDENPRISGRVRAQLENDDAEIAALEKKLGIKGKKRPKAFQDDGLEDLMADLFGDEDEDAPGGKRKRNSEEDEWLKNKRRKALGIQESDDEEDSEDDDLDEDDLMGGDSDDEDDEDEDDDDEDDIEMLDEDESGDEDLEGEDDGDEFEGFESEDEELAPAPVKKVRENPYIAPATSTPSAQKYIPPSLRKPATSESESSMRLRRQTQGSLNKLSEANLISILGEIEKLYRENPRQTMTTLLVDLLFERICDRSSLQDTYIILHAGFIAAIYKVSGTDFGAEIVQRIVDLFDQYYKNATDNTSKELVNLMSLISQLYNFHVIGSTLVFDYIRICLQDLTESNTELLLKVIRSSGPQLRQDDPTSLKDIVLMIQPAVAKIGEANLSVRTKFMIETITDLKNNRVKTGVAASAISSEHITRMRKILGSLNNRQIRATEPLRISLADIRNSEKKGKWWLVGASWKEEDPLEAARQSLQGTASNSNDIDFDDDDPDPTFANDHTTLLHLAKANRMNTDIRRSIFIAIMSATDFRDAYTRLLKLRLKKRSGQEGEIPRVLLHCAGAEDAYNPYYTLIARKLCVDEGKRIKMEFQFSLWDLFKKLGENTDEDDDDVFDEDEAGQFELKTLVNVGKMYGTLLADGTLPITILKPLNFAYLRPKTVILLEVMIVTMIITSQANAAAKRKLNSAVADADDAAALDEEALLPLFVKAKEAPGMVSGLKFFLGKTVKKSDIVSKKRIDGRSEREVLRWGVKVGGDALGVVEGKVRSAA